MSTGKILIIALIAEFILGIALGYVIADLTRAPVTSVACPTEDSCNVDYYSGAWHIVPGRPS